MWQVQSWDGVRWSDELSSPMTQWDAEAMADYLDYGHDGDVQYRVVQVRR